MYRQTRALQANAFACKVIVILLALRDFVMLESNLIAYLLLNKMRR